MVTSSASFYRVIPGYMFTDLKIMLETAASQGSLILTEKFSKIMALLAHCSSFWVKGYKPWVLFYNYNRKKFNFLADSDLWHTIVSASTEAISANRRQIKIHNVVKKSWLLLCILLPMCNFVIYRRWHMYPIKANTTSLIDIFCKDNE